MREAERYDFGRLESLALLEQTVEIHMNDVSGVRVQQDVLAVTVSQTADAIVR